MSTADSRSLPPEGGSHITFFFVASGFSRKITTMTSRTPQTEPSAPVAPPIEPMLAKLADELPAEGGYLYEPKWDGFRALVFRGADDVFIQSRDLRPLDRYFPDLHEVFLNQLPAGCVLDGE